MRYQFNIGDTARQCDPAGPSQAGLKIGVKGEVVIGPAGSAGTFSAPLKITVTRNSDKTDVFSQTYQVEADDGRRHRRRLSRRDRSDHAADDDSPAGGRLFDHRRLRGRDGGPPPDAPQEEEDVRLGEWAKAGSISR